MSRPRPEETVRARPQSRSRCSRPRSRPTSRVVPSQIDHFDVCWLNLFAEEPRPHPREALRSVRGQQRERAANLLRVVSRLDACSTSATRAAVVDAESTIAGPARQPRGWRVRAAGSACSPARRCRAIDVARGRRGSRYCRATASGMAPSVHPSSASATNIEHGSSSTRASGCERVNRARVGMALDGGFGCQHQMTLRACSRRPPRQRRVRRRR